MADDTELWPETVERIRKLKARYGCGASDVINRAVLVLELAQNIDDNAGEPGVIVIKIDNSGNITAQQGMILES